MIGLALPFDLHGAFIGAAVGILAFDLIGAFRQCDVTRRGIGDKLKGLRGRAVRPFAVERAFLAEGVDDRGVVAPIDHQRLAGEMPGAMKHLLADPPGEG